MAILFFMTPILGYAQYEAFESEKKEAKEVYTIKDYRFRTIGVREYRQVDTTLRLEEYHELNFNFQDDFYFMPYHNMGSFTVPKYLDLNTSIFPTLRFQSRLNHYKPPLEQRLYDVKSPFSEIRYWTGNKYGQVTSIQFAHSLNKHLSYGLAYRGVKNRGEYLGSVTDHNDINIFVRWESDQYELAYSMSRQMQENSENGGIVNDSLYRDNMEFLERRTIPTFLDSVNAKTKYFNQVHYLEQNVYLHRQKVDSLKPERFVRFHSNFQYNRKHHEYLDDGKASFYNSDVLFDKTSDSLTFMNYAFKVGFQVQEQSHYLSLLGTYAQNDLFYKELVKPKHLSLLEKNELHLKNKGVEFAYSYAPENSWWNAGISYERIFSGEYQDNSKLGINLGFQLGDQIEIGLYGNVIETNPEVKKMLYRSNYLNQNWTNLDFLNLKVQTFGLDFRWKNNLRLSFAHKQIENYTYYQTDFTPVQYGETIGYTTVELETKKVHKYFGWDQRLLFQQLSIDDPLVLDLPQISFRSNWFYNDWFFDHSLYGRVGVEVNYLSGFYGPTYVPTIGEFAPQNKLEIGNSYTVDPYISFKVKTMKIYVKYQNFMAMLNKRIDDKKATFPYNQYATVGHPWVDDEIRFGIVWYFFK